MNMVRVVSSNIEAVGYDEGRLILTVRFKNGSVYEYYEVSNEIFEGLLLADSVGKFHNEYVKNEYSYKRIR